jgi:hypothetical protein
MNLRGELTRAIEGAMRGPAYPSMAQRAALGSCMACGLGDAAPKGMDATTAMGYVVKRYVELSIQGNKLAEILRTGVLVPCAVLEEYQASVKEYRDSAQEVFDQLTAKGISVQQVIYRNGVPEMDPADPNKVHTLVVQAPLVPPVFIPNPRCPNVVRLSGAAPTLGNGIELGVLPFVAAGAAVAAACTAATLGTCLILIGIGAVIVGVVTYGIIKVVEQVAIMFRGYDPKPIDLTNAYTGCFDKLRNAGLSATDAAAQCTNAKAPPSTGLGTWAWIGIGATLLGLGTIVGIYLYRRGQRYLPVPAPVRALPPIPAAEAAGSDVFLGGLYMRPGTPRRRETCR